jgi:carbamoyl-phosphate synthase small subunit
MKRQNCCLTLSDGSEFNGKLIGAPISASGEMVFTTGMVGYSEALTDPSYFGQILIFSYPLIGNYGIPVLPKGLSLPLPRGFESDRVNAAAVIITIDSPEAYHWNSFQSLDHWLKEQNVPGIIGLDTRHLVHLVRQNPNLRGMVKPENPSGYRDLGVSLSPHAKDQFFDPGEHEILGEVSVRERTLIGAGEGKPRIGLIDCGVKWNIMRQLLEQNCELMLIPYDDDLKGVECDGWLLSNGPGDPTKTGDLTERITALFSGDRPILGICLGHQILSLAAGAKTRRMDYGHRSHNQPVYKVGTRNGFITSQNHGYVVLEDSIPQDWEAWFKNANDQTIEGIRHKSKPFRSVQFHPEAAGGPRDTGWILNEFVQEVSKQCQ